MLWETAKQALFNQLDTRFTRLSGPRPFPSWTTGSTPIKKPVFFDRRIQTWETTSVPFKIHWHYGVQVYIYPGEEVSRCIYLTGMYEPNQMSFLSSFLKKGMNLIDVGAHSGAYSLFFAKKVGPSGKVIAVEPSPREYARLVTHQQLNSFTNLIPIHRAAYDTEEGSLDLKVAKEPHTGHNTVGSFAYPEANLDRTEKVVTTTLDHLVESNKICHLDAVKIDAEGSEKYVLLGAKEIIRRDHPVFLIEIFDAALKKCGSSGSEVWWILTEQGYSFFQFSQETGLPVAVANFPGMPYTDFIAIHKDDNKNIKLINDMSV